MYHYIYKTTCVITGRYYLGMHTSEDMNDSYLGSGTILRKSIKKYGRENHIKEIICYCESRKTLQDKERELINESLLSDPLCMNLKIGGEGGGQKGVKRSVETVANMRKARQRLLAQGWTMSQESINNMKAKNTGRTHRPETKQKMSESKKGRKLGPFTDEHKAKLSAARQKRVISDETRAKISSSLTNNSKNKGWQLTPEAREKQKEASRIALSNKPKEVIACPHCGKIGGKPAMMRHHFENCKGVGK